MKVLPPRSRRERGGWLAFWRAIIALLGLGPALALTPVPRPFAASFQDDHAGPSITNEWCPVLTDEAVDPDIHADFQGSRVYFCCRKCLKQFQADPDVYLANLPATVFPDAPARRDSMPAAEQEQHSHEQPAAEQEQHSNEQHSAEQEHTQEPGSSGSQGHDHAAHGGEAAHGAPSWILWLGRLHPMWVHFPIALLLLAALAESLAMATGSERFAFAARFSLWVGTGGALVAASLGWADALAVAGDYSGFPARLLTYHRWAGVTTAAVATLALVLCERFYRRAGTGSPRTYRITLFLAALLVSATGHLGASLIFGWDYLSR